MMFPWFFAPYSNYVFTTASECVGMYHQMGIPSSTLMFGCNPKMFHRCTPKPEFQHDIILIANNYDWFSEDKTFRRKAIQDIVAPLVDGGYDIKIYGDAWTTAIDGFRIDEKYYGG